jgi:hypothetical protein
LHGFEANDFVRVAVVLAADVGGDILAGALDVAGYVEGVAGRFGDGEAVVEGDAGGNCTETWSEEEE